MRLFFLVILFFFSVETWAETYTIDQMETWVDAAPAMREAGEFQLAAEARARTAEIQMSPQLFGNGAIGRYTNPVFAEQYYVQPGPSTPYTQVYTPQPYPYTNVYGTIGLRFPLFGSREENKRNLISADSDAKSQALKLEVARWQTLKALRYAYSRYYFRLAQENLAIAFLKSENEATHILDERESARLVLDADKLEFQTMYFAAKRNEAAARTEKEQNLSILRALTGKSLENFSPTLPVLKSSCIRPSSIDAESHPQIKLAESVLEEKKHLLETTTSSLAAGVNIAQGIQKDMGGSSGRNTAISFDFTMPIFASDWLKSKRSSARVEVEKANIALETQRDEFTSTASNALAEIASKQANLEFAQRRLDAAREAYREAKVRAEALPGDVLEKLLQKKFTFYQIVNDEIEAQLQLTLAKVDLLGLVAGCNDGDAESLPEFESILSEALLMPSAKMQSSRTLKLDFEIPELRNIELSWYAWDGGKLMLSSKSKKFWDKLPHTSRILISFKKSEMNELLQKRGRLDSFISDANSHGIKVELLLGDPSWALPDGAEDLAKLVASFSVFPFSGIHLDIERSQLPQSKQPLWDNGIVEAVSSIRKISTLPITLSLHPRDANPKLLSRLKTAGLDEAAIMIYKTDRDRILEDIDSILLKNPELTFSLSQSVEPFLPETESYRTRTQANSSWRMLDKKLRAAPNFRGIIVQSLENYEIMKP